MFREQVFWSGRHCSGSGVRCHAGTIASVSSAARYRCTSCGNLTRFDVTSTRRTRAYHHYTVGGALSVEDEQVLEETLESVECRWCGAAGVVEVLEEPVDSAAEG